MIPAGPGRRQSPRIGLELPITVRLADGRIHRAQTIDLSLHGLAILADRSTAMAIRPGGAAICDGDGPVLDVLVSLPLASGPARFCARCRVRRFAVAAAGVTAGVEFGIEFERVSGSNARVLRAFVEESLVPAY